MAGFARKYDGGAFGFVSRFALDTWHTVTTHSHAPKAEKEKTDGVGITDAVGIEVCAEDFDRIFACAGDPPNLSEAMIRANERHKQRLQRQARAT